MRSPNTQEEIQAAYDAMEGKPIVPLHTVPNVGRDVTIDNGLCAVCANGSIIEVHRVVNTEDVGESPSLCIRIFKHQPDGTVSKLAFGLNNEAARALTELLIHHLRKSPTPPINDTANKTD